LAQDHDLTCAMPLKPLALAVTAASQRELFHVPARLPARPHTFLAPAQPAMVSPVAAYPIDVVAPEQAYMPLADVVVEDDGSPSWAAWGALTAAAVAGVAIGRAGTTARESAADEYSQELVDPELQAVAIENELARRRAREAGERAREAVENELAMLALMGKKAKNFDGVAYAQEMPGVTEPLGFWDPLGFCSDEKLTEGKLKFYREVELKHGRVGMLAALGFVVGENFHPLFGGDIDAPSYLAFQQTPLEAFWPAVVIAIAIPEIYSVFSFEPVVRRVKSDKVGQTWAIRSDFESGDLGFDPLGLKPEDPAELKEMQTKELNNGRLAMIAAAGMIVQELATGNKLL